MTTAQVVQESLKTSLFGMGLVIGTLYLLSLILDLMRVIFTPTRKSNTAVTKDQSIEQTQTTDTEGDPQLIAVITAALAHHL